MPDSSPRTCPKCATAIPASFPEGLCPKCLLEQAAPDAPAAGGTQLPTLADLDASEKTIPVPPPVSGSLPVRQMGVPSLETLRGLFPELEIVDVLGAGGMGAVYKARQPRLNRLVALKIMVAAPGHETDFALRFEREAQVLARLNHPHIVILYDFGELGPERTGADPLFYFLMEYVDGTDLGQIIKSKELTPAQALAIVPQICEALQYAHDQGITHRDIKPANILIDKRGVVKIADFGLAKVVGGAEEALMTGLTQTGTAMGTPHYMAPEQWEHPQQVDHRADIYALGVVFYEMLTGERPAGVFEPPSKKSKSPVDKKLDGVVMRAMDKDPERRYQQAGQIGEDVTRISGANKSRPATTGTPAMKRRPLTPLLALGVAAALAFGGWKLWPGREAGPPAAAVPMIAATPQASFSWGSSRYAFVNEHLSWPEARKRAEVSGGRLAVFESEAEEIAVREHLRALLNKDKYWIGGYAEEGSERIRWITGETIGKVSWYSNHPRWRSDPSSSVTQREGLLCAAALAVNEIQEGSDRWMTIQPQHHNTGLGFIIEWDDAKSPTTKVLGGASAVPTTASPGSAAAAPAAVSPQAAWTRMYQKEADWAPLLKTAARLYPDLHAHAELARDPASGLKLADGWLTPTTTWVKLPLPAARNAGVRLKVQMSEPDKMDGATIWLRSVDRGAVYSGNWRGIVQHFGNSSKAHGYLAERKNLVAKKPGESFTLEFYAIGQDLICRYDGDVLRVREPGENRAIGTLNHFMLRNPVTDIEFINLDGLSEAEALKLAGVETSAANADAAALSAKSGRLNGGGSLINGKAVDLARCAAFDDFVDVAGGPDSWVALRANGATISSDGQADFTGIRRIARSCSNFHCFIDKAGGLRFHKAREMTLPASLKGRVIVDAACGSHHGVALLEGGQAVVFGKRYEEAMEDTTQAQGTGTPRWPQPEAAALQNVKGVAVTYTHAATLHHDGSVSVWGWEGPLKWQPEPEMKPVRQISSHHDNLHLLDEAGQVWSFPLPRSAHPDQPVGFDGRVRRLGKGAVRLRDHLWLDADGAWRAVAADLPTVKMLESVPLKPETNFALLASIARAKPYGYALWIGPVETGSAAGPPAVPVPPKTALGGPSALPSANPGRLRASGTTANGKPHDLSKFAAHDDFVDVAGGWGRWVALRANGQTISSDGRADFTGIAKIAASFNAEYAFITSTGKLVIPDYEVWSLPAELEQGVVDAALGMQHGVALLEGGRAVVFGARYVGVVGDPADPKQYGTPRWLAPEARALEKVKAVAATVTHAATLHEDGTLSLWGWEGPLEWHADPRQQKLRQLRSTEDGFWALDEAGQLWHLPVPRNPAPGQPVHITGKPSLSGAGVTHLRPRCWRRKSGEWAAHLSIKEGMEMMKEAGLSENTAFSLSGGMFDGKPFASLLWIESK